MLIENQDGEGISFQLSSDEQNIDQVIRRCGSFLQGMGAKPSGDLRIVLRELLRNAIVHGNRLATEKSVFVSISRLESNYFKVTVQDQGDGFDFTALELKTPNDPRRMQNRGLFLINEMVDGIKFGNDGRIVSVIIRLNAIEPFKSKPRNGHLSGNRLEHG